MNCWRRAGETVLRGKLEMDIFTFHISVFTGGLSPLPPPLLSLCRWSICTLSPTSPTHNAPLTEQTSLRSGGTFQVLDLEDVKHLVTPSMDQLPWGPQQVFLWLKPHFSPLNVANPSHLSTSQHGFQTCLHGDEKEPTVVLIYVTKLEMHFLWF